MGYNSFNFILKADTRFWCSSPAKCQSPVQQKPASYRFSFFWMDGKKDFQKDFPGDCALLLGVHDF